MALPTGRRHHADHRPAAKSIPAMKNLAGDKQHDRNIDENPVDEGGDAVNHEPGPLPEGGQRRLRVPHTEEVALNQVPEILEAPRPEVGDFEQVRKHIVGVIAQEGVAVKEERGDPGDKDHVVKDGAHGARLGIDPEEKGERGDEDLHGHARPRRR